MIGALVGCVVLFGILAWRVVLLEARVEKLERKEGENVVSDVEE